MVSITLTKVIDTSDDSGDDQLSYSIPNFETFNIDVRTPISPMPLPEETADENVLVKVEGNTKVISLTWTIVKSDVDLAGGGKAGSEVKSVPEQISYISDSLQGSSLQHRFRLKIHYSEITGENDMVFYGFINNISFNQTSSSPVTFTATMSFIVGNVITTLDGDIPFEPTVNNPTTPGSPAGRLNVSWSAPIYKGASGSILDYDLEFINTTTRIIEFKRYGETGTSYTTPANSLTPGAYFQVRIRGNSADGVGKWSEWIKLSDADAVTPDGTLSSS